MPLVIAMYFIIGLVLCVPALGLLDSLVRYRNLRVGSALGISLTLVVVWPLTLCALLCILFRFIIRDMREDFGKKQS